MNPETTTDGESLATVCGYRSGDAIRFAAVFVENKGSVAGEARSRLSAADYQREFDRWTGQGYRPVALSAYAWDDDLRYAAIWSRP
jgi:hypothetical protein